MLIALGGVGALVARFVLLRAVRVPEGQPTKRPELLDISLALLVTMGLVTGVMLIVFGAINA